jgi:hypothetical protein
VQQLYVRWLDAAEAISQYHYAHPGPTVELRRRAVTADVTSVAVDAQVPVMAGLRSGAVQRSSNRLFRGLMGRVLNPSRPESE